MGQAPSNQRSLDERYYMQKVKLGEGAYGSVWRAVDRRSGSLVAVKQLDKGKVKLEAVERETALMQACIHENIAALYDAFEDADSIFLAMEYCDQGDFGDKLRERGENLAEAEAASFVRQAIAAVAALHQRGVCHRDVKPDNFMVAGGCLKLADFGMACFLPPGKLLLEKCGTPLYMAPEQHLLPRQSRGYGFAVDVWAAGILMYVMLCGGQHPFLTMMGNLDMNRLVQGAMFFPGEPNQGIFGFDVRDSEAGLPEAPRQLCRQLVCPSPMHRLTAQRALQHPWLEAAARPNPKVAKAAGAAEDFRSPGSPVPKQLPRAKAEDSRPVDYDRSGQLSNPWAEEKVSYDVGGKGSVAAPARQSQFAQDDVVWETVERMSSVICSPKTATPMCCTVVIPKHCQEDASAPGSPRLPVGHAGSAQHITRVAKPPVLDQVWAGSPAGPFARKPPHPGAAGGREQPMPERVARREAGTREVPLQQERLQKAGSPSSGSLNAWSPNPGSPKSAGSPMSGSLKSGSPAQLGFALQ